VPTAFSLFQLLFFVTRYFVDRYNLAYVHPKQPRDTGGRMFAAAFEFALVILVRLSPCLPCDLSCC
jgi:hypothetical protein